MYVFLKKSVNIFVIFIVSLVVLVGCNNVIEQQTNENKQIEENTNSGENDYSEEEIKGYSKDIDLTSVKDTIINVGNMDNAKVLKDTEVNTVYNLGESKGVESLVVIDEQDEHYQEIAVIKLLSEEQSDKIIEKFILRYEELKQEANKNNVTSIKNNIVMKQQAGIGIFIVSENRLELEKEIDGYF